MNPDPLDSVAASTNDSFERQDAITVDTGALSLPIEDKDLVETLNRKIAESERYFKNDAKLYERRKRNRNYWLGKHYEDETKFDEWEVPYKDNVIHQDLETRISIASSRLPDIIVTPSADNNKSIESAKELQKALEIKIKNRITRRIVKRGLRHNQLDFIGCLKFRWDPNLNNGQGDFTYELVRPDRIGFDHTATIPDNGFTADNMQFIYEWIEEPLGMVLAKFPKKADKILELTKQGTKDVDKVGKLKYKEVWFTWYDKDGSLYEGTAWVFKDELLDKMRNPYYDWEGYDKVVVGMDSEMRFKSKPSIEKAYYNFFDRPRKPYLFFSYESLGESPVDSTTIVEQTIPLQRQINKRGMQINRISDNNVPKKVFAGKYIDKEEARRVTNDPDEAIWLDGADDIGKAFMSVASEPVHPSLVNDAIMNRGRIDAHFATHGTLRGESQDGGESGLSKQITREGDLAMSDDMVDIVVERVMFETASWSVQMMKLFYDDAHFIRNMGTDGELVQIELQRESISDGIGIDVEASSVDKQTRRADAMNLASRKAIDPLSMFEDLDMPNPKERVRRWATFMQGEKDGYASYLAEIDLTLEHTQPQPAQNLNPMTQQPNAGTQKAQEDIQAIVSGQQIDPPTSFDETYVQTLIDFTESGQFDQLPEKTKGDIRSFVDKLRMAAADMAKGGAVAPDQMATNAPIAPAAVPPAAPAAPQPVAQAA